MAARRQIVVDASHDERCRAAGIGVGVGNQVLSIARFAALPALTSLNAEALAALEGIDYAVNERGFQPDGAELLTDCAPLVRAVRGEAGGVDHLVLAQLRAGLADHGLELRHVHRSRTRSAHRAARMALDAWRAGAEAERQAQVGRAA